MNSLWASPAPLSENAQIQSSTASGDLDDAPAGIPQHTEPITNAGLQSATDPGQNASDSSALNTAPTNLPTVPTTGFSFGSTPSNAPTTGFSFGSRPSSVPTTGFSFGSTPSSVPTTGFSFGPTTSNAQATPSNAQATPSNAQATPSNAQATPSNVPITGFSFGSRPSSIPTTGFSFGSTPSNAQAPPSNVPTTGFSFGSTLSNPQATPSNAQATPSNVPTTGFSFGSRPSSVPTTGFSFGSTPSNAQATLPNPQATPSNAQAPPSNAQAPPSNAQATSSNAPTTGFSFGSRPSNAPTTGFSFGSRPSSVPTTGFSFGSTPSNAPTTGFSFGSRPTNAPTTGFSFGSTPSNAQAPPSNVPTTGFSFGSTLSNTQATLSNTITTPTNAPTTGFSFGSTTSNVPTTRFSFGPTPSNAQAPSGFSFGSTLSNPQATPSNTITTPTTESTSSTTNAPSSSAVPAAPTGNTFDLVSDNTSLDAAKIPVIDENKQTEIVSAEVQKMEYNLLDLYNIIFSTNSSKKLSDVDYLVQYLSSSSKLSSVLCIPDTKKSYGLLLVEGVENFFTQSYDRAHFLISYAISRNMESPFGLYALLQLYLECPSLIPQPRKTDPFVYLVSLIQGCSSSSKLYDPLFFEEAVREHCDSYRDGRQQMLMAFQKCYNIFMRNCDPQNTQNIDISDVRRIDGELPCIMYIIGMDYLASPTSKINDDGLRHLERAADRGHATAHYHLYCLNLASQANYWGNTQLSHLVSSARKGHPYALYSLGLNYASIKDNSNLQEAGKKMIKASAELGCDQAKLASYLCEDLENESLHLSEGYANLLMEHADGGSSEALNELGNRYFHGKGVKPSPKKAVSLYREAASKGHPSACENLANCLYHGEGTAKNEDEAISYYEKAANAGMYYSAIALHLHYMKKATTPSVLSLRSKWSAIASELAASNKSSEPKIQFFTDMSQPQFMGQQNTTSYARKPIKWTSIPFVRFTCVDSIYKESMQLILKHAMEGDLSSKALVLHNAKLYSTVDVDSQLIIQFEQDIGQSSYIYKIVELVMDIARGGRNALSACEALIVSASNADPRQYSVVRFIIQRNRNTISALLENRIQLISYVKMAHKIGISNIPWNNLLDLAQSQGRGVLQMPGEMVLDIFRILHRAREEGQTVDTNRLNALFVSLMESMPFDKLDQSLIIAQMQAGIDVPHRILEQVGFQHSDVGDETTGIGKILKSIPNNDLTGLHLFVGAYKLKSISASERRSGEAILEKLAKKENIRALELLYEFYDSPLGYKHPAKALEYLKIIHNILKTDSKYTFLLGKRIYEGDVFQAQPGEGFRLIEDASKEKNVHAALYHSQILLSREKHEGDQVLGMGIIQSLVEKGDSDAMFLLGLMTCQGYGIITKDLTAGWKLLYDSASRGNNNAQLFIARNLSSHMPGLTTLDVDNKLFDEWVLSSEQQNHFVKTGPKASALFSDLDTNGKADFEYAKEQYNHARTYFIKNRYRGDAVVAELLIKSARKNVSLSLPFQSRDITMSARELFETAVSECSKSNFSRAEALLIYSLCCNVPNPFHYLLLRVIYLHIYNDVMAGHNLSITDLFISYAQRCSPFSKTISTGESYWSTNPDPQLQQVLKILHADYSLLVEGSKTPSEALDAYNTYIGGNYPLKTHAQYQNYIIQASMQTTNKVDDSSLITILRPIADSGHTTAHSKITQHELNRRTKNLPAPLRSFTRFIIANTNPREETVINADTTTITPVTTEYTPSPASL